MTDRLVGTWNLVSWELRLKTGAVRHPLGEHAVGRLVYTADGYMMVSLMRSGRAAFASPGLFEGSAAEKASAAESYASYSGRYELLHDRVLHHVDLSLFPNWIGTVQERLMKFDEGRLVLYTEPFTKDGEEQIACLVWERPRPSTAGS
jgi:hypothetical protein